MPCQKFFAFHPELYLPVDLDRTVVEAIYAPWFEGHRVESLDEHSLLFNAAVDYWNVHFHPVLPRKKPQDQVTILRGCLV